jgi:hypothetical protein
MLDIAFDVVDVEDRDVVVVVVVVVVRLGVLVPVY